VRVRWTRDINLLPALWMLVWVMVTVAVDALWLRAAKADVITEIGGGIESPITNPLARPDCTQAFIRRDDGWHEVGCGGRNPVFIGWPIAWESPNGNTRIGWFHMSHWFDGVPFNKNPELTYNCICATHKFTWRHR
jgi:hypothetical protein